MPAWLSMTMLLLIGLGLSGDLRRISDCACPGGDASDEAGPARARDDDRPGRMTRAELRRHVLDAQARRRAVAGSVGDPSVRDPDGEEERLALVGRHVLRPGDPRLN